jgi:hypothetical protein
MRVRLIVEDDVALLTMARTQPAYSLGRALPRGRCGVRGWAAPCQRRPQSAPTEHTASMTDRTAPLTESVVAG